MSTPTALTWPSTPDASELTRMCEIVKSLVSSSDLQGATLLQQLADNSRNEEWRKPIGEAKYLETFIPFLSQSDIGLQHRIQVLRLVGNCCAYVDENRARVVDGGLIPTIVGQIENPELTAYVATVLFNICNEFEPAELAVSEAGFSTKIYNILTGPNADDLVSSCLPMVSRLIGLLSTHDIETANAPLRLPIELFSVAPDDDLDDFLSVVTTGWSYLATDRFKTSIVENPADLAKYLDIIWTASYEWDTKSKEEAKELQTILQKTQQSLLHTLAEITGLDEFMAKYPLDSDVCKTLQTWISPSKPRPVAAAACLALGNLARSDEITLEFVGKNQIHLPLIEIIEDPTPGSQLIYSAIGFLRNLALPVANKKLIVDAGIFKPTVLPRIWELDVQPQVQHVAITLTRILLVNSREHFNVLYDITKPVSENQEADGRTLIQRLIDVGNKSDDEANKLEVSRTIASICRILYSDKSEDTELPIQRAQFFKDHPKIPDTLARLVTQSKHAVLRSESWFIFALMARSPEGIEVLSEILNNPAALDALQEAITGKKKEVVEDVTEESNEGTAQIVDPSTFLTGQEPQAPQGQQTPPKIDRENGLVLVSKMLKELNDLGETGQKDGLRESLGRIYNAGIEALRTQPVE